MPGASADASVPEPDESGLIASSRSSYRFGVVRDGVEPAAGPAMSEMRSASVFGARSALRMAIILICFGLRGCAPLVKPFQLWGLDELSNAFPPGASGRDLDKELISRGFKISSDLAPPHHEASFAIYGGITCVTHVGWDEDRLGKIASNLRIIYPCASL
jgi:hypothetical protein